MLMLLYCILLLTNSLSGIANANNIDNVDHGKIIQTKSLLEQMKKFAEITNHWQRPN